MANTYDVYFGLPGDMVLISSSQAELELIVPFVLEYNTEYNWRVDTITGEGTITGDVWSFVALLFAPPLPTGVTLTNVEGEEGEPTGVPTGENNMITVRRLVAAANNTIFFEDE